MLKTMCVYNERCFTNYVDKVKDVECEEESNDVSHSGFRTDNEIINESEIDYFLVAQLA